MSHSVGASDRRVVRASDFDEALKVGIKVVYNLGVLRVDSNVDKKLLNEIIMEQVEKLKKVHKQNDNVCAIE